MKKNPIIILVLLSVALLVLAGCKIGTQGQDLAGQAAGTQNTWCNFAMPADYLVAGIDALDDTTTFSGLCPTNPQSTGEISFGNTIGTFNKQVGLPQVWANKGGNEEVLQINIDKPGLGDSDANDQYMIFKKAYINKVDPATGNPQWETVDLDFDLDDSGTDDYENTDVYFPIDDGAGNMVDPDNDWYILKKAGDPAPTTAGVAATYSLQVVTANINEFKVFEGATDNVLLGEDLAALEAASGETVSPEDWAAYSTTDANGDITYSAITDRFNYFAVWMCECRKSLVTDSCTDPNTWKCNGDLATTPFSDGGRWVLRAFSVKDFTEQARATIIPTIN